MEIFLNAFIFVLLAEMGDKSQILAATFASKYKLKDVIIGVAAATILLNGIAVIVGGYLGSLIPVVYVKIAAAVAFLIFGLLSIRPEADEDEEGNGKTYFNPIATITIAFFLSEFGDKTQLMSIALSAKTGKPVLVFVGAVLGMLIADGLGIIGASVLSRYLPEKYIKWGAGAIFIIFGIITLYQTLPAKFLVLTYEVPFFIVLAIIIILLAFMGSKKTK